MLCRKLHIGFVNERGGIQCLMMGSFSALVARDPAELFIDERKERCPRLVIPAGDFGEQARNVGLVLVSHGSQQGSGCN